MNKKQIFCGMLTAMALAACSSDDAVVSTGDATVSDGTPRYINVKIANAGSTRAATYEDGNATEHSVSNVRFYFFNEDGTPASVKGDGTEAVNYLDWTSATGNNEGSAGNNVEYILNTHLVINTKDGDRLPKKMLAVVNVPDVNATFGNTRLSLTQVREKTDNYKTLADNGTFVMANSVYVDDANERISTTTISSSNMVNTQDSAYKVPVEMYVERNVAKVTVGYEDDFKTKYQVNNELIKLQKSQRTTANTTSGTVSVGLNDVTGSSVTEKSQDLYLKVTGWNLAATTELGYLSKHINTQWETFTNWTDWNDPTNYRSYWGMNVMNSSSTDAAGTKYFPYITSIDSSNDKADIDGSIYTNENAASLFKEGGEREYPTQVVVCGTLCDENGEAVSFGEFAGTYYTEASLKQVLYSYLNLYTDEFTDDNKQTRKKLDISNLEFISESDAVNGRGETALNSQTSKPRCYVELGLTDAAIASLGTTGKLYTSAGSDATAYDPTSAEVKAALASAGKALLWKDGRTYYWFKVKHLAPKDKGEYGVVRNHVYKCNISSVTGLGTPVFDPTEPIYPETPSYDDTYVAARINVLAWRIVSSSVPLGQ